MADKITVRIKGHEKFSLREGWLTKGLYAAKEDAKIFNSSNGTDVLGVGTNMVKSIKYWMQAFGLLSKEKGNDILTDYAELLLEMDPFFEDKYSLWFLHSQIAKNVSVATSWYMFFNKFDVEEFKKDDVVNTLQLEITHYANQNINIASLKDDVDVLINMYSKYVEDHDDPEDKNVSPLAELGLIKKNGDRYIKCQPDLRKIPRDIILYEVCCLLSGKKEMSIYDISHKANGLAHIYNLSDVSINEYLDQFETKGYIHVDRAAGLDMVYVKDLPTPMEVMKKYYK